MNAEQAKQILDGHFGELTGLEKALYTLIEDLEQRIVRLEFLTSEMRPPE